MTCEPTQPSRQVGHAGFYRALEDRVRGSREVILSRLRVYLPFIEPLKLLEDHPAAIDLGCGRGEWLELITANAFNAQGVDLDEDMLAACCERNLHATKEDAIALLKKLPNDSQLIVSGFHIAEHLPFSQLQILVQEALRILKPAGLLILETPNPENFSVTSRTFYSDPTHHNLLPPELLSFLIEYYEFARIKIARLQENHDLFDSYVVSFDQVLSGASPDYAVIAQKAADANVARLFDGAFDQEYGLAAHVLAGRFDRQLTTQSERTAALERRVAAILDEEHEARIRLQQRLNRLEERLDALLASRSWKIIAALRSVQRKAVRLVRGAQGFAHAVWTRFAVTVGIHHPPQKGRPISELSPQAEQIYAQLKSAIAKRSQEV